MLYVMLPFSQFFLMSCVRATSSFHTLDAPLRISGIKDVSLDPQLSSWRKYCCCSAIVIFTNIMSGLILLCVFAPPLCKRPLHFEDGLIVIGTLNPDGVYRALDSPGVLSWLPCHHCCHLAGQGEHPAWQASASSWPILWQMSLPQPGTGQSISFKWWLYTKGACNIVKAQSASVFPTN